ncbi:MAG TPA: hypothetical protein VNZ53_23175, partial [Steroidobacteraceae bacterium]|nr:hypothetical protein [Steroidobacteraceae bacterium]
IMNLWNRLLSFRETIFAAKMLHLCCIALGGVDSKASLLGANQIQGCFWGGSLGCDGPFGFERCGMGTDGASDYRSA